MRLILIQITTSLLAVLSFSLGVYSLVRNPKARVVQLWFAASMAVTVWAVGYILTTTAPTADIAGRYVRIVYFGASFVPIFSFHFVTVFLFKHLALKWLIVIGYVCSVVVAIISSFTPYVVSGVRYLEGFGHYEEIVTPWFYFLLAYFLFFSASSVYLLISAYPQNDGIRRHQLFYLIFAFIVGFVGAFSNFVTDLTGIYPYGQMIVWLYPILVTWGIFVDEIHIRLRS